MAPITDKHVSNWLIGIVGSIMSMAVLFVGGTIGRLGDKVDRLNETVSGAVVRLDLVEKRQQRTEDDVRTNGRAIAELFQVHERTDGAIPPRRPRSR